MDPQRRAFLVALAENEDDDAIRLVFADWLDDHGEHEEAQRHRVWRKAKAFIVKLLNETNQRQADREKEWWDDPDRREEEDYDPNEEFAVDSDFQIPYDWFMNEMQEAYDRWGGDRARGLVLRLGWWESFSDRLNNDRRLSGKLWRNWCIVTGNKLPDDFKIAKEAWYSCAC